MSDTLQTTRYFGGGITNILVRLASRIELFTGRKLAHQAGALNAMRGIFQRYTQRASVDQYWGVPCMSLAYGAYDPKWTGIEYPPRDRYTLNDRQYRDLHAAFGFGLLWTLANVEHSERRAEFTSWSWTGWIAPIVWPGWASSDDSFPELVPPSIPVIKDTGEEDVLAYDAVTLHNDSTQVNFQSHRHYISRQKY
jgi:hypothetical protein